MQFVGYFPFLFLGLNSVMAVPSYGVETGKCRRIICEITNLPFRVSRYSVFIRKTISTKPPLLMENVASAAKKGCGVNNKSFHFSTPTLQCRRRSAQLAFLQYKHLPRRCLLFPSTGSPFMDQPLWTLSTILSTARICIALPPSGVARGYFIDRVKRDLFHPVNHLDSN